MTTATQTAQNTETQTKKTLIVLSGKTQKWCQRIAGIAMRRAFKVKAYQSVLDEMTKKGGQDQFTFSVLPKIYHRKRISHTDGQGRIFLHPEFFNDNGGLRKKIGKESRDELKAAIFKEVVQHHLKRTNIEFFKVMVRCPWVGKRVTGAEGSDQSARSILEGRKQDKKTTKRKMHEVSTGLKEEVRFWDLTARKHVTVMADIFLADGKIKIARAERDGRKLRTMLKGAETVKTKLSL
tara:strand:- start:60325 stop:61035 length:711 start_codon:yes stop_codon:yes gene_type:complete